MTVSLRLPSLLCFASLLALAGCKTPAASAPPTAPPSPAERPASYRSVHIDTLAPEKAAQFIDARREWVGELKKAHATDGRGVFLEVGTNRFFTLRSFSRFGDFDTRGEAIERSLARVPKEASERYDRLADTALVFPHTSEIWQLDAELTYVPESGPKNELEATVGRLILEDVRPDPASQNRYWDATGEMNRALAEAHYPLARLGFRTMFGAGHVMTLWLGRTQEELDGAGPPLSTVARVRGDAVAKELALACDGAIEKRETQPFVVRHDLTKLGE